MFLLRFSVLLTSPFKRARTLVNAALSADPADADSLYLSARVHLAFRDAEAVLALAEKAAAANPQNADYQFLIARACGDVARHAGVLRQVALGRRVKAEAEKAIAIDPGHIDATQGLLARARLAEGLRDPALAETSYREAVRTTPNSFEGHAGLARIYASGDRRDPALAEQHALALVQLQPARITGYSLLAAHYAAGQEMAELNAVLSTSARAIPDHLGPWFEAGQALTTARAHLDVAERYLRHYLTQEPEAGSPTLAEVRQALEAAGRVK